MDKERRRHERSIISQVIELSTSDGHQITAQGINISESGLLCRSDHEIVPGTYVMFQLSIPGSKSSASVSCEGTVLKCTENNGEHEGKYDLVIDFTD